MVFDPVALGLGQTASLSVPTAMGTLAHRPRTALPMDPGAVSADAVLLLDTTVYIDGMKRTGLPAAIQDLLANHLIRHSPLCVGELSFGFGRLDPSHPGTPGNRSAIAAALDRLELAEFVHLSPTGWAKAGALAGSLARTQGFALDRRRALFVDAALFMTAQEAGLTLVSGNLADMDLLLRVGGAANVLLYGM